MLSIIDKKKYNIIVTVFLVKNTIYQHNIYIKTIKITLLLESRPSIHSDQINFIILLWRQMREHVSLLNHSGAKLPVLDFACDGRPMVFFFPPNASASGGPG